MTMRIIAGILGGEFLLFLFCCTIVGDLEDGTKFLGILHVIAAFIGAATLAAYAVEFAFTGTWGGW